MVADEDVEGGQVGGSRRAAGQLVRAVGDEWHGVKQALEVRGHGWNPAPGARGGGRGGGRGRCCHDSRIGIDRSEGTCVVQSAAVAMEAAVAATAAAEDCEKAWSAEPCFVCGAGAGYATDKAVPPGSRAGSLEVRRAGQAGTKIGYQEVDPCCTSDAGWQPDCKPV